MIQSHASTDELIAENSRLRAKLEAIEETIRAIQWDEVDALVVGNAGGERVYTLGGADASYRTLVEVMGAGALTVTGDGSILYCNRHFAQIVGRPNENLVGESIFDFIANEDEGLFRAMIWEGLTSRVVKRQIALCTAEGEKLSAAWTATPITVGGITSVCMLVDDLTEHESRVAAEAASAAKDRFLALLSHELRTPLTPVVMAINHVEQLPGLPEEARADLAMIRRNIELERRLIDDLLDVSRVTTGKLRIVRQPVSAHSLMRNIVEMLRPDFEQKQLDVACDFGATRDTVNADSARLQQVLWNLTKNAIKFSHDGGKVRLCSRNEGSKLIVEVRDEGIGIDAATMPRIFEAFEQGEAGLTSRHGGLGLGLAIARGLIEAHGGVIQAESDGVGRGACFRITLDGAAHEAPSPADSSSDGQSKKRPMSICVLLVEDHRDTAIALGKLLGRMGCDVSIADGVAAGLRMMGDRKFNLVISDIGLPDGTGYDLMREIRRSHAIPGIALTGYGMEDDLRSSSDAGFAEHVTKPIEVAELERVIARVMERDGTGDGSRNVSH